MEEKIKKLIERNYKNAAITSLVITGDNGNYLMLRGYFGHNYQNIAVRILNKFPEIKVVHYTGGWTESVYTRETLRWGGYNIK